MFVTVNGKFLMTGGTNAREDSLQPIIHPAARRMAWLVVIVGAVATSTAAIYSRLDLGQGIVLPFTKSALDSGWLFVFGLLWLITGVLALWWLRPAAVQSDDANRLPQYDSRLIALEKAIQTINTRLKAPNSVVGPSDSLHELNLELDNLGTSIQDVHRRLDDLGDVNSRLDDLASQLDAMYITVQDAHKRIDDLAQSH
jgi:hypothetical protein